MKLVELKIAGLKCFRDEVNIPLANLSVLVGENDSGKSTVLRAIDLCFILNRGEQNGLSWTSLSNASRESEAIKGIRTGRSFTLRTTTSLSKA